MSSARINKKIVASFILVIAFTVGYVRETTFVVINSVINEINFPYNPSYQEPPSFLYKLSTDSLILIKWGLTFVFSVISMFITLILINYYFRFKTFNRITVLIYLFLFGLSLIISVLGILFNQFDSFYTLSRLVAGLIQYPLLTLILFTLFYLIKRKNYE